MGSTYQEALHFLEDVCNRDIKKEISKETIKSWMQDDDLDVQGVVSTIIFDDRCYPLIVPPLEFEDYHLFLMKYYKRCIIEDPKDDEHDYVSNRYIGGYELTNWIKHIWNDVNVPQRAKEEYKNLLSSIYKNGDQEIKGAIECAILEHLFTIDDIAKFFSDWENDPILQNAYRFGLESAKHFKKYEAQ